MIETNEPELQLPAPPRLTLREIADECLYVDALLEQAEGELTPEIEVRLNQLAVTMTQKADGVAAYIDGLLADENVLTVEIKRLQELRVRVAQRAARYQRFVMEQLIRMDRRSVSGAFRSLDVVSNPPKLKVLDAAQVPDQFKRTVVVPATETVELLEDDIKQALRARENVLAARAKLLVRAARQGAPEPVFEDADLPPVIPGAVLERGTRLRVSWRHLKLPATRPAARSPLC